MAKNYKFLDGTILPSDVDGKMGDLRNAVSRAFNRNRNYPDSMKLLRNTLLFVLSEIDDVDYDDLDDFGTVIDSEAALLRSNELLYTALAKTKRKLKEALTQEATNASTQKKKSNSPRKRTVSKSS